MILFAFIIGICLVGVLSSDGADAADGDFNVDGIEYQIVSETNGTVKITDYTGSATELTIPSEVTNESVQYSVTSIGNRAFVGCDSLTSVTIPDSVTSIGYEAFGECSTLTSITIPNSVTSIGNRAFYGCSSLTSITIPDSVTSIGYLAFYGCTALSGIDVSDDNLNYKSDDEVAKAMAQFGHHKDYIYSTRHFGPHDITTRDVATGVTRKNVAKKYGVNFRAIPKAGVLEGIDLVRRMLLNATFDGDKCLQGLRALKEYHKTWNDKMQLYEDKPCHDWSSHGADGFRYVCQAIIAFIDNRAAQKSKLTPEADHDYNPFREKAMRMELKDGERARRIPKKHYHPDSTLLKYADTQYDTFKY